MATKKRSLMDRMLLGSEKSEDYARNSLPSNRWELFWDIIKGSFWRLCLINLLIMLFLLPLFALFFVRYLSLATYGTMVPFSQCFGVGYFAPPTLVGYAESVAFRVNISVLIFLPIVAVIAAVGISGGAYIMRNIVWTEGIFVANDFWRGIKLNFKNIVLPAILYSVIISILITLESLVEQVYAMGGMSQFINTLMTIFIYFTIVFSTFMFMHTIAMAVTYECTFFGLVKNSFLFTIGLMPMNIFFGLLCAIPIILCVFGGIITVIGVSIMLLFGFSLILLIWTDYCQWGYDRFINDKVAGAKKNRGIYQKTKNTESLSLQKYHEQQIVAAAFSFSSKPIKPITDEELQLAELPTSFNRADIEKLNESKEIIYKDHEKYIEEHKNDPEFVKQTEEKEDVDIAKEKRIKEAQKELSKRKK